MADPEAPNWQRVEEFFELAVASPPEKRAAILDEHCGDDPELRGEVESLLAADAIEEGFLDRSDRFPQLLTDEELTDEELTDEELTNEQTFPSQIGPYPVEKVLGRGGMGVVYLGEDSQLERQVAIKTLSPELRGGGGVERLKHEARMLAALGHPNVATIYGLEQQEGHDYLVLEYIAGENLAERLSHGPLGLMDTLRILSQVAAGLEAAHEQGIVHRDLKPANVRITKSGQAKVVDFGIAKSRWKGLGQQDSLTATGTVLGTASYMSPEQIEGRQIDARTDIWAFGCVLWECLTGRRPYEADNSWGVFYAVLRDHPDWDSLPEELPPRLVWLLRRCLRKDPLQRLRNIGDARLELTELLTELSEGDRPTRPESAPAVPDRVSPGSGFQRGSWTLAGLLVLGAAIGGYFLGRSGNPERQAPLHVAVPIVGSGFSAFLPTGILAMAPGGERLAEIGGRKIYLHHLSSAENVELFDGPPIHSIFFSPDGAWLGGFSGHELLKLPTEGGTPITVKAIQGPGIGGSWSDDGRIIYAPDWNGELWSIHEDGGDPEQITRLDTERGELSHRFPHVLPGGRVVLYTVKRREILSFDDAEIGAVDLVTGEQRILIEKGIHPGFYQGFLIFSRQGSLFAVPFDADQLEVTGIPTPIVEGVERDTVTGLSVWSFSKRGDLLYLETQPKGAPTLHFWLDSEGEEEILDFGVKNITRIHFSPDGKKAVLAVMGANNSLWLHDRQRGTSDRLVWGQGNAQFPIWSPDGQWITFILADRGRDELVEIRSDGTGELRRLWAGDLRFVPVSWSPDGQNLLVQTFDSDIWVISRQGAARPLLQTPFRETSPTFSSNGDYFIFGSNETGREEVYLRRFPESGPKLRISTGGGSHAFWSEDGRFVFFRQDRHLWRTAVDIDPEPRVGEPERFIENPRGYFLQQRDGRFLARRSQRPPVPPNHLRLILGGLESLR